jgi:two-component system, sensor histidine kinase and response regulator
MDDHITKPIDPDKLFDALVKWIPAKDRGISTKNVQLVKETISFSLPETLPGIDIEVGLRHVSGNKNLFGKLLREFNQDYNDAVSKIIVTFSDDAKSAERMAHSIKGIAGSIGAASLQDAALALEMGIREGKTEEFEILLSELELNHEPVLQGLKNLDSAESVAQIETGKTIQAEVAPIDIERLAPLFDELNGLLKPGHSKCPEKLLEIRESLANNATSQIDRIHDLVENYEYEDAIVTISEVANMLDTPLKS